RTPAAATRLDYHRGSGHPLRLATAAAALHPAAAVGIGPYPIVCAAFTGNVSTRPLSLARFACLDYLWVGRLAHHPANQPGTTFRRFRTAFCAAHLCH